MSGTEGVQRPSMAVDTLSFDTNPFDAIRFVTLEGREYWSARDLMPLLGYERWERFADAIGRAKVAAHNAGYNVAQNFPGAAKVSGSRGPAAEDYHLSRYACYLVALNGDPRKPEIAAAQTYFVIKTREAEVAAPLQGPELLARAVLEAQAMLASKDQRIAELEPKAESFDAFMDADGCYSMKAAANAIGWGRNVMMRELRRAGVLTGDNLPYQRYSHHFRVVPKTFTNGAGETRCTATTYVLPSGVDFIRKKLQGALELAVTS